MSVGDTLPPTQVPAAPPRAALKHHGWVHAPTPDLPGRFSPAPKSLDRQPFLPYRDRRRSRPLRLTWATQGLTDAALLERLGIQQLPPTRLRDCLRLVALLNRWSYRGARGWLCNPTRAKLMERLGWCRARLTAALNALRDAGWIWWRPGFKYGDQEGRANQYVLLIGPVLDYLRPMLCGAAWDTLDPRRLALTFRKIAAKIGLVSSGEPESLVSEQRQRERAERGSSGLSIPPIITAPREVTRGAGPTLLTSIMGRWKPPGLAVRPREGVPI